MTSSITLGSNRQLRALRGATTTEANTVEAIGAAVADLVQALVERNQLIGDQVVSVTFSVTADLDACFPAAIARRQPSWAWMPRSVGAGSPSSVHWQSLPS